MPNARKNQNVIVPRFIRLGQAPGYLGVKRDWFNQKVRPYIVEIKEGKNLVLFDRLDLDDWADQYKERNGRLGNGKEKKLCRLGSSKGRGRPITISREPSSEKLLDKALERHAKRKQTES